MAEKLPKELFVHRENEGTEDELFLAVENIAESVLEVGNGALVGRYVLVETMQVEGTISVVGKKTIKGHRSK